MGYARLFPQPAKLKRKADVPSGDNSFSKQSLSKARAVKAFSDEWADEVTEGTLSLNAAFERVQAERERKATDAER